MKKLYIICFLTTFLVSAGIMPVFGQIPVVYSPDKNLMLQVDLRQKIYYSVWYKGSLLLSYSPVSMNIREAGVLGANPSLLNQKMEYIDEIIKPLYGKRQEIRDFYNKLILDFTGNFSLEFRVYNEGVAYRFITRIKGDITVINEEATFRFTDNLPVLLSPAGNFQTSYEYIHEWKNILDVGEDNFTYLPVIVKSGNTSVAITESDLRNYPGMYLGRIGSHNRPQLEGIFPAYPLAVEQGGWGRFEMVVTERAGYIARTAGTRSFPWRVMIITDDDRTLPGTDLVYQLASPCVLEDTGWIKPGKVTWEWWNDWNLEGVDFRTGINTKTYEYYIDFAAKYGLEYILFDEGWSDQFDLTLPNPELDMPHLIKYASDRNVGIILWCVWHTIDRQMDVAMDQFKQWGVAGIKVDFIDRDDQLAIGFYERCGKEAAKRHLLVDYHGCSKPTGLSRTYPNIINYEGVIGNEYNKGDWRGMFPTPEHNVTIPFTRMIGGPMDYTPGAMRNSTQTSFGFSNSTPMSRGTRCHQLGMYVVYDAPLQMLCDAPTEYIKYPDILDFLAKVSVTWDQTIILDARLQDYIITARQKGNSWYIGGMNDWTERTMDIPLHFLPDGDFTAEIIADGINASRLAGDYQVRKQEVNKNSVLKITMAPGGGFVIRINVQ